MSHIIVRTGDGQLLGVLPNVKTWQYARQLNDVGWWKVVCSDIDRRWLDVDRIFEFYRTVRGAGEVLLGTGFLRTYEWSEGDAGASVLTMQGPDPIDLLARRVIAYNTPTSTWQKSGHADDLMKEVVDENMGPGSSDPWYGRGRAYDAALFHIAADEGKGQQIEMQFHWRNVLAVLQNLAEASAWGSQDDGYIGYPIVFDLEYVGPAEYEFRTYSPIRGIDRTLASNVAPVIFSKEAGNLSSPSLAYDYSEERNIIYGLGPGEGENRMVDPENDPVRERLSPWNLHEDVVPATECSTLLSVAWRAFLRMEEKRPRVVFSGKLMDTAFTRFGVDWNFGDIVTVRYRGMEFDGTVDSFMAEGSEDGSETVTATMRITKALEGHPD